MTKTRPPGDGDAGWRRRLIAGSAARGLGVIVAVAVAAGATVIAAGRSRTAADALARLTGALAVALAAGLVVDGVRAV